ncbi:SUN domain-containing Suco/Slp1-like protein, partial [Aduncisulcus paluster]
VITIDLGNKHAVEGINILSKEMYSGTVKDFEILVSPCQVYSHECEWISKKRFTAKPTHKKQHFSLLTNEGRFLETNLIRFKWLSHHGSERLCTLTQIEVQGWSGADTIEKAIKDADKWVNDMKMLIIENDKQHDHNNLPSLSTIPDSAEKEKRNGSFWYRGFTNSLVSFPSSSHDANNNLPNVDTKDNNASEEVSSISAELSLTSMLRDKFKELEFNLFILKKQVHELFYNTAIVMRNIDISMLNSNNHNSSQIIRGDGPDSDPYSSLKFNEVSQGSNYGDHDGSESYDYDDWECDSFSSSACIRNASQNNHEYSDGDSYHSNNSHSSSSDSSGPDDSFIGFFDFLDPNRHHHVNDNNNSSTNHHYIASYDILSNFRDIESRIMGNVNNKMDSLKAPDQSLWLLVITLFFSIAIIILVIMIIDMKFQMKKMKISKKTSEMSNKNENALKTLQGAAQKLENRKR